MSTGSRRRGGEGRRSASRTRTPELGWRHLTAAGTATDSYYMSWIAAAVMKVVFPGVLVTLVLAACGTVGDADPHVIDTRTGEAPICKDFAGVVEDTVRDDSQEVTAGLRNLARDLQALAQGRSPEAANDQFDGSGPRIYVKLVDFERAFGGAHDPRYVYERPRYDWEDTLETRLLADKEYCTLYYIYRGLLGREDNSIEAIYTLIMQTVRDRVLPEIIEQARGEGF